MKKKQTENKLHEHKNRKKKKQLVVKVVFVSNYKILKKKKITIIEKVK